MSPDPDQPLFTASLPGESPPDVQASYQEALRRDAALHQEATSLEQTARRLAAALKQEAPVHLTMAQRHQVLHGPHATGTRPAPRRAWLFPTLATAGLAAALAAGLWLMPQTGSAPMVLPGGGIPSVAIQPPPPGKNNAKPPVPPPALANGRRPAGMPDTSSPESPATFPDGGSMAAIPPTIKVIPEPTPAPDRDPRDSSPPGRPIPGKTGPDASLAHPGSR